MSRFLAVMALVLGLWLAGVPPGWPESFTVAGEFGGQTGPARIVGDIAFVARAHFLEVLDLGDPGHPKKIKELDLLYAIVDLDVAQSVLLVFTGDGSMHTIDISNPASPVPVRAIDIPYSGNFNGFAAVTSSTVALRGFSTIRLLELNTGLYTDYNLNASSVQFIEADSRFVYVFLGNNPFNAFRILQLDGLTTPTQKYSGFEMPNRAVRLAGNILYTLDWSQGYFTIRDLTDRAAPKTLKTLPINGTALEIAGDWALVQENNGVIRLIDVRNPANPVIKYTFTPAHAESRLFAYDGTVALLIDIDGCQVLEQTPSDTLVARGRRDGPVYRFWDMASRGSLVCAANGFRYQTPPAYLTTLDISNPTSPTVLGRSLLGSNANYWAMTLAGDYALTVLSSVSGPALNQLLVYSIADPTSPTLLGRINVSFSVPRNSRPFAASAQHLYICERSTTMTVYSLTPAGPVLARKVTLLDDAREVLVDGPRMATVSSDGRTLRLYDRSDPLNPKPLATYLSDTFVSLIAGARLPVLGLLENYGVSRDFLHESPATRCAGFPHGLSAQYCLPGSFPNHFLHLRRWRVGSH